MFNKKVLSQPFDSILVSALALALLAAAWFVAPLTQRELNFVDLALLLGLAASVVFAYQYPIHLNYRLKLEITSLPQFLMLALLPPAIAITGCGVAVLLAELSVRSKRGNYPTDIATQTARTVVVAAVAGLTGQLVAAHVSWEIAALVATAAAMWVMEGLTIPFLISPVTGDRALNVLREYTGEGLGSEIAQYIVGILGAVAARQEPLTLFGLIIPVLLVYRSFKSAHEMQTGTRAMLENLADTVDLRDPYTGGHSRRVTDYTELILKQIKLAGPDYELIVTAARVHDIGKIGVPDYVLNKPGPLTDEERLIMESHAARGADLLRRYGDFTRGVAIVRHHHERWDGKGYPDKLKEYDIPLGARIIAVADSYDAMTSDRPYRRGMPHQRAIDILTSGRAEQWDAELVDAFIAGINEVRAHETADQPAIPNAAPEPVLATSAA